MQYKLKSKYLSRLLNLKTDNKNLFGAIALLLIEKIKTKKQLENGLILARELSVSPSTLSKFVKLLDLKNLNELILIHNQTIMNNSTPQIHKNKNHEMAQLIKGVSELIEVSNKIFFMGVSGSLYANQDFSLKLMRMNKWVIAPVNKYEQIGLSKLLNGNDVLIVNSLSMQHPWMADTIAKTQAKVVLISSVYPKPIADKINFFLKISSEISGLRVYTTKERIDISLIYNEIYEHLIAKEKNYKLLKLTSYH